MGVDLRSIRNGNVWTKVEGRGHEHGFKLQAHLESKNAVTLPDILELSTDKYEDAFCIGTRKLLERNKVEENGKNIEKLVFGEYEWKTYRQVQKEVLCVDASMQNLGFKKGDRVAILAETRADWLVSAIGCLRRGMVVVTLYTNLCDSGLVHGISETEVDTIFTSFEILPRLSKLLPQCDLIKNVIVFEDQLEGIGNITVSNVKIMPFKSFLAFGNSETMDINDKPVGEDHAIIMYTSGSTGNPKGVEMTHINIFYAFIAYTIQANLTSNDRYIAYLPLAHIMELGTEVALISLGVTIAYSSPFTLTNNSPKISLGTSGDARVAKPTSMTAVPLILDRIIKAVTANVQKQGKFKTAIFREALRIKQGTNQSLTGRILDTIIFNKVKAELGGSVKMMVVGGAPLSPQTHSMIRAMFGCTLQVGYGCTETTACIASMDSDDVRTGHAGPPNPHVMLKLVDWKEGDYKTTDKPRPRGEIVVGGKCVTSGYFKLPEETAESFYIEDGVQWFKTGDIGELDETGVIFIIDRKKDLVKLKHGEYISLGSIESKLKTSPLIDNICVFADPIEDHSVAIIIPSSSAIKKIADGLGLPTDASIDKLCVETKVIELFLDKLKSYGKQVALGRWDIPQAIHLTTLAWTPDNGLVTAALKLKRRCLLNEYNEQIKQLYNKSDCIST